MMANSNMRSDSKKSGQEQASVNVKRVLLWLLPLLSVALALVSTSYYSEQEELALAQARFSVGDFEAAERNFSRHSFSPWQGPEARTGMTLCELLTEQNFSGTRNGFEKTDLDSFSIPLMMSRNFFEGHFKESLKLAQLAKLTEHPLVPLFQAAALAELGRHVEARTTLSKIPVEHRSGLIAHRLEEALQFMGPTYGTLVRDRSGELIGYLDQESNFQSATGVDAALIPKTILREIKQQEATSGVRLSIDLELSRLARTALGRYRGSIVLLDPRTGAVLAAVSDRRTLRREETPAFEQRREPASIAKIITATAAFREGLKANALIARMKCNAVKRYRGGILYCSYRAGWLHGLDEALAISCNVAFADLGIRVGRQTLLDEYRRWGFDQGARPREAFGSILQARGNERQLADLSIGLNATDITPLHAALMASVIANDGLMPNPAFVVAHDGFLGLSPRSLPRRPGRRVVPKLWLPKLLTALQAVVGWRGTASGLAPPDFPVAMKTGTASEPGQGYHTNYIGVGPLPDSNIAFCVRTTHQPTSRRIRYAARTVTRRLLNRLAKWRNGPRGEGLSL